MFTQSPKKVESNPLRQVLKKKGYSIRAAARALNMLPSQLVVALDAHDTASDFPKKIQTLPPKS